MLNALHVIKKGNSLDVAQGLPILYCNFMPGIYCLINLPEIQQSVRSPHLVHLAIYSWSNDFRLAGKAEILQIIYPFFCLLVMHNQCTAFDSIVYFRCMETQSRHVSRIKNAFAIHLNTECMSCVINHFKTIFVSYFLNSIHIAWLAINMDRHDCRCLWSNGRLNLIRIKIPGLWIDVYKYRLYPVPPQ